jgi:hypothetical protein
MSRLTPAATGGGKAAADRRRVAPESDEGGSPGRWREFRRHEWREASWSAPALWRFGNRRRAVPAGHCDEGILATNQMLMRRFSSFLWEEHLHCGCLHIDLVHLLLAVSINLFRGENASKDF